MIPRSGNAATACRRAWDLRGSSKTAPKPNTIRSTEATTELNQSASSSGCATTTAFIGCGRIMLLSFRPKEGVVEVLERCGLPVDVESTLNQRTPRRAHLVSLRRTLEQLGHSLGERSLVALRHQKA